MDPSSPQDLEISVKELRTILNRIISKREPAGVPWLPPPSFPTHGLLPPGDLALVCVVGGTLFWACRAPSSLPPEPTQPLTSSAPPCVLYSGHRHTLPSPHALKLSTSALCPLTPASYPLCFEAKFVSLRLTRALMVK